MLFKLLLFFVFFLPFQFALNPFPSVDLAIIRLLAVFLFLAWIFQGLKKKEIFIPQKIQILLLLSFLCLAAFSLFFAQNYEWSLRKIFFLLSFFPIFFVVADLSRDPKRFLTLIKFLVAGAGIAAIGGILQFFLQFVIGLDRVMELSERLAPFFLGNYFSQSVIQNSSWLVNVAGRDYLRSFFVFPDPHMFSFFLGMILSWSVALAAHLWKTQRWRWIFSSFLILISTLLTFSRGGYLGLGAGAIFTFFLFHQMIPAVFRKTALILLFSAVIFIFLPINPISQRMLSSFNLQEGSNQARLETWRQSLEVIKENPLGGTGIGNYPLSVKSDSDYREPIYAHNIFLDIAAETGIANALIFIALILFSINSYLRQARFNYFFSAGAISLVVFFVHSFFDTPLFSVHILPLFVIIIAISTIDFFSKSGQIQPAADA